MDQIVAESPEAREAMAGRSGHILTLNAGSSSIKFALFVIGKGGPGELMRGQVEGLGAEPRLTAVAPDGSDLAGDLADGETVADHADALGLILRLLRVCFPDATVRAVGHRVVHGGVDFAEPVRLDETVVAALEGLVPLAPLHQPHNLAGVRAATLRFPDAAQIACFDTAFHRSHPWVNDTFALPRAFYEEGIRRYGFHGLSYEYLTEEMTRRAPHHAAGRMVVAHLGNGASLCAIRDGRSVGSTMGFTALDGLPMGTRCGQLDPGVVLYLMGEKGLSHDEITALLYKESGLRGLSGLSHDMRVLEGSDDPAARQAVAYFVTRIKREIGAMAALIGGLDALVFSGGIGEHSAGVRGQVASGFDWLGLDLDHERNMAGAEVISTDRSRVRVFVLPTDEERMIARHTARLFGSG
ncbi:MAG: acetate/propionate family kinase [Alphaproteobacteria bacterium]|nr:acetate/propionate family kinase [Alphaproteobacteria bacterium]